MFIKQIGILGVLYFFSSCILAQEIQPSAQLQAAYRAEGSLQLTTSKSLFEKVSVNDKSTKEEKCKALRSLAIQDWKFYKDKETAYKRLIVADSIGDYRSETWIIISRIAQEAGEYEKALHAAKTSEQIATSNADKQYAKYKYSNIVLTQAITQYDANATINTTALKEASMMLQEVLAVNPTNVNAANVLVGISLLLEDGDTALKAWLAYYRFADISSVYDYLKEPAITLEKILLKWNKEALNNDDKIALVKALAQSRFYTYARLMAINFTSKGNTFLKNNVDLQHIIGYANHLEEVKKYTNEYYRKMTLDKGSTEKYLSFITDTSEELYEKLTATETVKDTFSMQNFRSLIRSKFGTVAMIGRTSSSNIMGLVMGQIVNERVREVEQYGHSAAFNFTELDMMVSNGYPSWYWEDRGAGGFAIRGGFLRVKKMFKYLGISAWESVTDAVKRKKAENKIRKTLLESSISSDKNTVLAGLASKLELDALDQLYKELLQEGYTGITLQLKFIEQYDLYRDNATMFAHEGRHSLDRIVLQEAYTALGTATIEYRARLSQIVFSESPKLELANMVSGTGTTGSGMANTMIVEVAEEWIKTNTSKINGYDKNKIPIAQLYLLTNDQIKSIYRNVDPFYKKE
ncbi:hypothetical protein [uncultured Dokdonia sp.]|uniref:tetratricopeptide repeat protein n=1 Tax=uncultured Dokdonia sp. TaxID=575653 RepID=UPI0026303499|nr:hypothetical protein [uncultured Dokdonia sp.]